MAHNIYIIMTRGLFNESRAGAFIHVPLINVLTERLKYSK